MSMEIWENPEGDLVNSTIIKSIEQKAEDELKNKKEKLKNLRIEKAELVAEKKSAKKEERTRLNKETKTIEAEIDELEKEIKRLELEKKEEVAKSGETQPGKPEETITEAEPIVKENGPEEILSVEIKTEEGINKMSLGELKKEHQIADDELARLYKENEGNSSIYENLKVYKERIGVRMIIVEEDERKSKNIKEQEVIKKEKPKNIEEKALEIKKELLENAGNKSKEELVQLISDVEKILDEEKEKGKGKLKDKISEIRDSEFGKEKFTDDSVVYLPKDGEAIFIGDTHGDPDAAVSIMEQEKFIEAMENGEKNKYLVFLGDYVDRGKGDVENIEQIMALKKKYPDNIIMLRGNHETTESTSSNEFLFSLLKKYGDRDAVKSLVKYDERSKSYYYALGIGWKGKFKEDDPGKKLFEKYHKLFEKLPGVVVCANGIVGVHGGIPSEDIKSLKDLNDKDLLFQMRWNDPSSSMTADRELGNRGSQKLSVFSEKAFDRFMDTIGGKIMIRAHEETGNFENRDKNIEFNNKLVTVFSTGKSEKGGYDDDAMYAKFDLSKEVDKIAVDDIKKVDYIKPDYEKKNAEKESIEKAEEFTVEKINNMLDKWGKEKEKLVIQEGGNPAYRIVEFIYNPDINENRVILEDENRNRKKMNCEELYRLNYSKVEIMKESEAREKDEKKKWNNINRMLRDFKENEVKLRIEEGGGSSFIITELPSDNPDYVALKNINDENDERAISRDVLHDLNPEAVEFRKAVREEIKEAEDMAVEKIVDEEIKNMSLDELQAEKDRISPVLEKLYTKMKEDLFKLKRDQVKTGRVTMGKGFNLEDLLKDENYVKMELALESDLGNIKGMDKYKRILEYYNHVEEELQKKEKNVITPEGAPEVKGREELAKMAKRDLNREIVMVGRWLKKIRDKKDISEEEETEMKEQEDYLETLIEMKELSKAPESIREAVENLKKIEKELIVEISEKYKEFAAKYDKDEEPTPEEVKIAKVINKLQELKTTVSIDTLSAMMVESRCMSFEERGKIRKKVFEDMTFLKDKEEWALFHAEKNLKDMIAQKKIEPMIMMGVNRFAKGVGKAGMRVIETQSAPIASPEKGEREEQGAGEGKKKQSRFSSILNRFFGGKKETAEQKEAEKINKKIGVEESRIKWFEKENKKIEDKLKKKEEKLEEAKKSNNKDKADKIEAEIKKFRDEKTPDIKKNNEEIEKSKKELERLKNENSAGAEQEEIKSREEIVESLNKQIEAAQNADDLQGVFDSMFEIKLIEDDEDRKKFKEKVIDKLGGGSEKNLRDVIGYSNGEIVTINRAEIEQENKDILIKFYEKVIEIAGRGKGEEGDVEKAEIKVDDILNEIETDIIRNSDSIEKMFESVERIKQVLVVEIKKGNHVADSYYQRLETMTSYYNRNKRFTKNDLIFTKKIIEETGGENARKYFEAVLEKIEGFIKSEGTDKKDIEQLLNDNEISRVNNARDWNELIGVIENREIEASAKLDDQTMKKLHEMLEIILDNFDLNERKMKKIEDIVELNEFILSNPEIKENKSVRAFDSAFRKKISELLADDFLESSEEANQIFNDNELNKIQEANNFKDLTKRIDNITPIVEGKLKEHASAKNYLLSNLEQVRHYIADFTGWDDDEADHKLDNQWHKNYKSKFTNLKNQNIKKYFEVIFDRMENLDKQNPDKKPPEKPKGGVGGENKDKKSLDTKAKKEDESNFINAILPELRIERMRPDIYKVAKLVNEDKEKLAILLSVAEKEIKEADSVKSLRRTLTNTSDIFQAVKIDKNPVINRAVSNNVFFSGIRKEIGKKIKSFMEEKKFSSDKEIEETIRRMFWNLGEKPLDINKVIDDLVEDKWLKVEIAKVEKETELTKKIKELGGTKEGLILDLLSGLAENDLEKIKKGIEEGIKKYTGFVARRSKLLPILEKEYPKEYEKYIKKALSAEQIKIFADATVGDAEKGIKLLSELRK